MSPLLILWVIFAHWVADFVCQSNWMASNKGKNWTALFSHVCMYSGVMGLMLCLLPAGPDGVFWFGAITFIAHFITDAITSRITSKLFMAQLEPIMQKGLWGWSDRERLALGLPFNLHWFFVVIGFDQVLHYAQLFLTLAWVMSWPN